jgi:hypothetical protein
LLVLAGPLPQLHHDFLSHVLSQQNLETQTTRGLTSAERKAAESVYGNSIDYDHIVLDESFIMTIGGSNLARTTPWTINFPPGTLTGGGPNMSWLIHELCHSWQYQRGVSLKTTATWAIIATIGDGYNYGGEETLAQPTVRSIGLGFFITEQQAEIAKDAYEIMTGRRKGNLATYKPYLDEFQSGRYRIGTWL